MTKKEGELSKKLCELSKGWSKLGLKVTDTTCAGKAIGLVGGVRRLKPESTNNGKDDSSEPVVN